MSYVSELKRILDMYPGLDMGNYPECLGEIPGSPLELLQFIDRYQDLIALLKSLGDTFCHKPVKYLRELYHVCNDYGIKLFTPVQYDRLEVFPQDVPAYALIGNRNFYLGMYNAFQTRYMAVFNFAFEIIEGAVKRKWSEAIAEVRATFESKNLSHGKCDDCMLNNCVKAHPINDLLELYGMTNVGKFVVRGQVPNPHNGGRQPSQEISNAIRAISDLRVQHFGVIEFSLLSFSPSTAETPAARTAPDWFGGECTSLSAYTSYTYEYALFIITILTALNLA